MRPVVTSLLFALALPACQASSDEPGNSDTATDAAFGVETAAVASPSPATGETPANETAEPATDECGADKLGRWLNVLPTDTVKTEIAETIGHARIRYIAPGDMVTMDLRPDRLNVETGADGRIKLFRCG